MVPRGDAKPPARPRKAGARRCVSAPGRPAEWPCRGLGTCRRSGGPRQHRVIEFALQRKCPLLLNVLPTLQGVHIHPLDDEFRVCLVTHREARRLRTSAVVEAEVRLWGPCVLLRSARADPRPSSTVAGSCEPAWAGGHPLSEPTPGAAPLEGASL